MSYDVTIGSDDFNYTYNLSALFYKHIQCDAATGLQCLDGLTGKDAAHILSNAAESINAERRAQFRMDVRATCIDTDSALSAKYTPDNGWGSYAGALVFLWRLTAACYRNPRKRVSVG